MLGFFHGFVLVAFLFARPAEAGGARPSDHDDFGASQVQSMRIYHSTARDVVLMDEDALSEVPWVTEVPGQTAERLASLGLARLSHLQQEWEGILMESREAPIAEDEGLHPEEYHRASIAFPTVSDPTTAAVRRLGPFDLKGTGLSPEIEAYFRILHTMLKVLVGRESRTGNLRGVDLQRSVLMLKLFQDANIKELKRCREMTAHTPVDVRGREKEMKETNLRVRLAEQLLEGAKRLNTFWGVGRRLKREILETIRSMDYQNGLLPLNRAIKEFLMGLVWKRYLHRYNSRHGTSFGVVANYAVITLPVYILEANGRKTRAAVLVRQPSWRQRERTAGHQSHYPSALVNPVIGQVQTDIFGNMIDLELPGFQVPPADKLLGWSDERGHLIETAAQRAADAWLAGDRRQLEQLRAQVERLADEAPVPDEPFPVEKSLSEASREARGWISRLHEKSAAGEPLSTDDFRRIGLLIAGETSYSEKRLLLLLTVKADFGLGSQFVEALFTTFPTEAAQRKSFNYLVGDALALVLNYRDPFQGRFFDEDDRFHRKMMAAAGEFYPRWVSSMSRSAYVAIAHRLKWSEWVVPEDFSLWYGQEKAIIALVTLHLMDLQLAEGVPLTFPHLQGRVGNDVQESWARLFQTLRLSPKAFALLLFTAEHFTGRFLSERVLRLVDPDDQTRAISFRRQFRARAAVLKEQVASLRASGSSERCVLQLLLAGTDIDPAKIF